MESPEQPQRRERLLDLTERLLLVSLYAWLVTRNLVGLELTTDSIASRLPLILSEGVLLVFLLIRRRAAQITPRLGEWFLALGATCAPLLVRPIEGPGLIPGGTGGLIVLVGFAIQLWAKISLGRSFGVVPAIRGLQLRGPYRIVRHPMYAGYLVSHIAIALLHPTPRNFAIYAIFYTLQIPRILAEERLLSQEERYRDYQREVPYRLLPGVF
jgi:protein-S-isoprenylcysteine O-methyltransferase Ste14